MIVYTRNKSYGEFLKNIKCIWWRDYNSLTKLQRKHYAEVTEAKVLVIQVHVINKRAKEVKISMEMSRDVLNKTLFVSTCSHFSGNLLVYM